MPNFSGRWTLTEQLQGIAAGTWTGITQYELYTWGSGTNGKLGLNNTVSYSSPTQVGALTTWADISAGAAHTWAVRSDGTLWSWGSGSSGALGQNDIVDKSSPTQVGALTNWSKVSCGDKLSHAIKTDGTLWGCGYNSSGGIGDGTNITRSSPVQVGALTTWLNISSGAANSQMVLATQTDGTLWSWGKNNQGQLGQNNNTNLSSPVQVGALTNWAKLGCGEGFSMAIKADGTLWGWGYNSVGNLGAGDIIKRSSPVQIGALTDWAEVKGGQLFTAAVKTDGTLWTWGYGGGGRLANDNNTAASSRSSPVQVGALTDWSKVTTFLNFAHAIKTDGTLWAWGNGGNGRLGDGTSENTGRSSPVQIGSETTWYKVSNGELFGNGILTVTT